MPKNILLIFLNKLFEFPLWVKQIIYLKLYKHLEDFLSEDFIQIKEEDVFHVNVPVLTFLGRTELTDRKNRCEENVYTFLANVSEGLTILETAMNNFWTLEEVAKQYIFCLEQDYIKAPDSPFIPAMAGFMSGKYRTGEYFKRTGKIDVDQLEQTIVKQKEYAERGNPMKMAEVMISLGFITEKDCSSLLVIKEEAKKRFILDSTIIPKDFSGQMPVPIQTDASSTAQQESSVDVTKYRDEISRLTEQNTKLTEQNNKLKVQLTRILAFVKKNG